MKFKISNIRSQIYNNKLIILILFLASSLRLYRIQDYMTFLGDEGRDVLVVYNILHGHLTLLGPTSSVGGFFLGPIYYYFMAPFLWLFNYNPVGPAVMVALFGIATVWLLYKFVSEIFNTRVGLIAAFLYSVSPIVISYSRSSWNPNPLPFFALLIMYVLYRNSLHKNNKLVLAAGILLGIAMQLHYLSLFLATIMFVYILCSELVRSKFKLLEQIKTLVKEYAVLLTGFVIGWSPFLAFELRHGFPDFIHIIDFVAHSGDTGVSSGFFASIYDVFFRLFARLVFAYPQVDQFGLFNKTLLDIWGLFALAIGILSLIVLLFRLYQSLKLRNKDINKYLFLSIWIILGVGLFGLYKKAIYEYYFAFMFPLPFILTAFLIDEIGKFDKNRVFLVSAGVIFIAISLLNLQGVPFRYQPNRQLNQMKTISQFVLSKTDGKPFNFALITGSNSDYAYRYFFTIWGNPPVTIQDAQVDPLRKTVTNQLMVVCESLPCHPLGNPLWEIAGFGRADVAGEWNVSVVQVYRLVHYKGK